MTRKNMIECTTRRRYVKDINLKKMFGLADEEDIKNVSYDSNIVNNTIKIEVTTNLEEV